MSRLGLTNEIRERPPEPPYKVMALSGGGYRGLFAANVLASLAAEHAPITEDFGLFAGTSIGGLVATALALDVPPRAIRDAIERHGPSIFDDRYRILGFTTPVRKPRGSLGGVLWPKFSRPPLVEAIREVLRVGFKLGEGEEADDRVSKLRVGDVGRPLLLVATCATTNLPFFIGNLPDMPGGVSEMPLLDALLATTAAPGYFPAVDLEHRSLVDGGLVANAPDLVAVAEVLRRGWAPLDRIRLVSIGTARANPATPPSELRGRGVGSWARDLVPLILSAQEALIVRQAQALLGPNMLRIDAVPSPKQASVLALDRATPEATATLRLLADGAIAGISQQQRAAWFARPPADAAR